MPAAAKKPKKTSPKTKGRAAAEPRVIKAPRYRSFSLQKRIKPAGGVPTALRLFVSALGVLVRHWKLFLGITVVYAILNILLVQGFSTGVNITDAKKSLEDVYQGGFTTTLLGGVALFTYVLGNAGNDITPAAEGYQLILGLLISLALIWGLREVYAGHKVRIRDAFYRGAYPLVPFFLVLCVIGLQLIPFAAGALLFGLVTSSGIATSWLETALWGGILFVLALTSLYLLCSSIFALYAVCLPNMTPMAALRAARSLVAGRRMMVIRKLVFLPIALLVLAAAIVVPAILLVTPAAGWVFFGVSMAILAVLHSYMYALYRSLL